LLNSHLRRKGIVLPTANEWRSTATGMTRFSSSCRLTVATMLAQWVRGSTPIAVYSMHLLVGNAACRPSSSPLSKSFKKFIKSYLARFFFIKKKKKEKKMFSHINDEILAVVVELDGVKDVEKLLDPFDPNTSFGRKLINLLLALSCYKK
jgi:hypothetical protein